MAMTHIRFVNSSHVNDGKNGKVEVRAGDNVKLLPPELMDYTGDDAEYFAKEHHQFMIKFLGEGPYEISKIGEWRCGRIMLYFKTSTGHPGAHAHEFMYHGPSSITKK